MRQQLFLNIAVAGIQQRCCTRQGNHRQPATGLSQQLRYTRQMLVIPLRGNELDDGVLGLLEPGTRFANNQLVNLRHIRGRQVTALALLLRGATDHASQRRLDVQQRTGNIHQYGVVRFPLTTGQGFDHFNLIENDPPRLAKTQHCEGIGNLLERCLQRAEISNAHTITAHEQIQTVFHPNKLFAQRRHYGAHGAAIRTCQLSTLFVHDIAVG